MKHLTRRLWIACALTACIAGAAPADELKGKTLLLAAASTTDAVEELRREFEKLHPGAVVRTSFGASSALAKQIAAGAEADLFLSASDEWADFLAKKELVAKRRDLLGNRLVIVVADDSKLKIKEPADLAAAEVRRLALADPQAVPAGVYAKQALEHLNLWEKLRGKVAGAPDVRQALQFVATGAADAGIVYATDAAAEKRVRVALVLDPKLTQPIRYPLVLVKREGARPVAAALYEYLASPAAAAVFSKHGFIVLPAEK